MEKDKEKELPVRYAKDIDILFPNIPQTLKPKEGKKIQNAVKNGSIAFGNKTFHSKSTVRTILGTDKPGTQIVFNNAPNDDIKIDGDIEYMSTPELQKVIAYRREEARPALERERLKYGSDCVDAFSQCPVLKDERAIQSDRNINERKGMTQKAFNERKPTCSELTGEPFDDTPMGKPVGHHKDRVADKPEKALDTDNIAVIRTDEHIDFHNSDYLPTSEGFEQAKQDYKKKKKA